MTLVREDFFTKIVNVHWGVGGFSAVDAPPDSNVYLDTLGDTDKISIALWTYVSQEAIDVSGSIPLFEFGYLPFDIVSPGDPGNFDPRTLHVIRSSLKAFSNGTVSAVFAGRPFDVNYMACGIYLDAIDPRDHYNTVPTPVSLSLETNADNSDLAPTNVIHFGVAPSWASESVGHNIAGPGFPAGGPFGVLGWAFDDSTPPLVAGDCSVSSLVNAPRDSTYTFTFTPDLFTRNGNVAIEPAKAQLSISAGGGPMIFDAWNSILLTADTSRATSLPSRNAPPSSSGNTVFVVVNNIDTSPVGVVPQGVADVPSYLGLDSSTLCPFGAGPGPNFDHLPFHVPAWQMALGGLNFALPNQLPHDESPRSASVAYAAVQVWRGKAIDWRQSAARSKILTPGGQIIKPGTGVAAQAFGPPDLVLDGGPSSFPLNRRGLAGELSVTGGLDVFEPYPKIAGLA